MNKIDAVYLDLIDACLMTGSAITTRNSDVLRVVAETIRFDSTPLVSVRRTAWKNCLREWEWFMRGSSRIDDLHESVRHWWKPWVGNENKVHNNYSEQFRAFNGIELIIDQIAYLIDGIRDHPYSRRNVITTWNTADMTDKKTKITNCHGTVIQAFVDGDNELSLVTYQRSADVICGVPHNWLQYWAFLMWLSHRSGRKVGSLTWIGGDIHLYNVHKGMAQRMRDVNDIPSTPNLVYTPTSEDFLADDFTLDSPYEPAIKENVEMVV